jgi:aminodeoxyfutalosine synthase
MTASTLDRLLDRVAAGEALAEEEITGLSAGSDILALGMLADTARRRLHESRVTYLRVAACPFDGSFTDLVPPAAREVRLTGTPDSLAVALTAVEGARAVAGDRVVSGFSWGDVIRLSNGKGIPAGAVLTDLRAAGLDHLAEIPIDGLSDVVAALEALADAGFERLRVTIAKAPAAERTSLFLEIARLQEQFGTIHAINPLPMVLDAFRPTTGYDDVKAVAIARLAAPGVATIQVDWLRYGPKLAQVALTFGADDLDGVTASEEAPDGRRRCIEAAGFVPVERDGHFRPVDDK